MTNIAIHPAALLLIEALLTNLREANRLDGYIARESGAYGAIKAALIRTIACAIMDSTPMFFDDAMLYATRLYNEALDNGENIEYQINLLNCDIISL